MNFRTDLTLERAELASEQGKGIKKEFKHNDLSNTTIIDILNEETASKLGKAVGRYITIEIPELQFLSSDLPKIVETVKDSLDLLLPEKNGLVLVAGVGNSDITADALGPFVASKILSELPSKLQVSVFQRIAALDRTSPEIIKIVENILLKKLGSMASVNTIDVGGVNYLAEVMNNIEHKISFFILVLPLVDKTIIIPPSKNVNNILHQMDSTSKIVDLNISSLWLCGEQIITDYNL